MPQLKVYTNKGSCVDVVLEITNLLSVYCSTVLLIHFSPPFYLGAHVRDAACYLCWSFARAYDPEVIQPYVNEIAASLLITTVFDREVNCRRAASVSMLFMSQELLSTFAL